MNAIVSTPALQQHMDAQVRLMTELTNRVVDSVQRVADLNMRFTKQYLQDLMNASKHMMSANDPVELGSAAVACCMPVSEHARDYSQQLINTLAGAQVELTRTAEQHVPEASRTATAVADEVARRSTEATQRIASEQRQAMERMKPPPDGHVQGGGAQAREGARG
jgi:phasin family protein